MSSNPTTAAVILCGSGRGDGSEIHEATSILIHLARLGVRYQCFAPDRPQADVVNHLTGQPMSESRNCLVEAARIARGNVRPLSDLRAGEHDCLLFPGGFGAAKNLCTFAKDGAAMKVSPDVERLIGEFHRAGKPIGLCCIAPVLAAKVLEGVNVTLGAEGGAPAAARSWGARHTVSACASAVVDTKNKLVTSPAYMYDDATPYEVFTGIGEMVGRTVELARAGASAAARA